MKYVNRYPTLLKIGTTKTLEDTKALYHEATLLMQDLIFGELEIPLVPTVLKAIYLLDLSEEAKVIPGLLELWNCRDVPDWTVWEQLMEKYPNTHLADNLNRYTQARFGVAGTFTNNFFSF